MGWLQFIPFGFPSLKVCNEWPDLSKFQSLSPFQSPSCITNILKPPPSPDAVTSQPGLKLPDRSPRFITVYKAPAWHWPHTLHGCPGDHPGKRCRPPLVHVSPTPLPPPLSRFHLGLLKPCPPTPPFPESAKWIMQYNSNKYLFALSLLITL